jgi:signal peptide peptidase SppA
MAFSILDRRPRVALLRLAGTIAPRGGPLAGQTLNIAGLAPAIERAFAVKRLAGVMLAINSPGGSPVQSSLIAARIRALAEAKKVPVVAVVEDAAASGGYWLACAADEIVVDPASIVGSIGVIAASFGFQDVLERLGVERRLETAGTQKSFMDPFRPTTEEERARLRELLDALHGEFTGWVETRRGPKLAGDRQMLFSGRFWTGREAVALGLADGMGDLHGELRRRFGEKARLVPVQSRRAPLIARLLDGGLAALEERAAWARLGL